MSDKNYQNTPQMERAGDEDFGNKGEEVRKKRKLSTSEETGQMATARTDLLADKVEIIVQNTERRQGSIVMNITRNSLVESKNENDSLLEGIFKFISPSQTSTIHVSLKNNIDQMPVSKVTDVWDYIEKYADECIFKVEIGSPDTIDLPISIISTSLAKQFLRYLGVAKFTKISLSALGNMFGFNRLNILYFDDIYDHRFPQKNMKDFFPFDWQKGESKQDIVKSFVEWLNKQWDENTLGVWAEIDKSGCTDFFCNDTRSELKKNVKLTGRADIGLFLHLETPLVFMDFKSGKNEFEYGQKLAKLYGASYQSKLPILYIASNGKDEWSFSFLKHHGDGFEAVTFDLHVKHRLQYKIVFGVILVFLYNTLGTMGREKFYDLAPDSYPKRCNDIRNKDQQPARNDKRPDDFERAAKNDIDGRSSNSLSYKNRLIKGVGDSVEEDCYEISKRMKVSGEETEFKRTIRDFLRQMMKEEFFRISQGRDIVHWEMKELFQKMGLVTQAQIHIIIMDMLRWGMTPEEYLDWQEKEDGERKRAFAECLEQRLRKKLNVEIG